MFYLCRICVTKMFEIMKINQHLLFITFFICMFSMGIFSAFGQKAGFASRLKAAMSEVEKAADKDPDSFKANIERMEQEWGGQKSAVERSLVHAMLGSAYREMRWTHISDYDEESKGDYTKRMKEHFDHVLDDMEALAGAKSRDFGALLDEKGKDNDLYDSDMLSVMLRFVEEYGDKDEWQMAEVKRQAFEVYKKRGNLNGYALLKKEWLDASRKASRKQGYITEKQYEDSLHGLMMEVKDKEVGADMALAYMRYVDDTDEKIEFLRWALENMGSSKRKVELQSALENILQPTMSMSGVDRMLAGRSNKASLRFWNCERVQVTVRKYVGRERGKNQWGALLQTGEVVDKREVVMELNEENRERKAKNLPVRGWTETEYNLPAGRYLLIGEGLGQKSVSEFKVSTMHLMSTSLAGNMRRIYVVDNETGRPLAGIKVQCRESIPKYEDQTEGWENRGVKKEYVTGADGTVDVPSELWVRVVRNADDYTNYAQSYDRWSLPRPKEHDVHLRVMTDRSIYRPGQKVMGSVVAFRQMGDVTKVVTENEVNIVVKDAQWKVAKKLSVVLNEYGTASFEFDLPEDAAVGRWHMSFDGAGGNCSEDLRVEEYKRPTFDVEFEYRKGGKFGETVEAVGTAMMLAGVPVQGANVHYTVECQANRFRWWWYGDRGWESLGDGDLVTDDDGKFRVPVHLTDEYMTGDYPVVRFRVKAQVTDQNGESHEAQWSMNVSDFGMSLDVTVDKMPDLGKNATFKIDVFDTDHEKISMNGTYQILLGTKAVAEGTFASGDTLLLPTTLLPGVNYCVEATVTDPSSGREEKERAYFTPYNSAMEVTDFAKMGTDAKFRPEGTPREDDIFFTDRSVYEEKGYVDIYFSTVETDAYIIYNVYNAEGLLESSSAVTDGRMKHLRMEYRKEWGEGISVRAMYVRNGHCCLQKQNFTLARPEKKLKMEWSTFRDKLEPGQQEQWTLTVTDKDGKKVSGAEMMAVLYDASLDRIYSHYWGFGLSFSRHIPSVRAYGTSLSAMPSLYLKEYVASRNGHERTFDILRGFEHDRYLRFAKGAGGARMLESRAAMARNEEYMVEDAAEEMDMSLHEVVPAPMSADETAVSEEDFDHATIRKNFAETAFFLPHLVSDKKGNVQIQFTLPESLTEWQFMGFAHTNDVDYGMLRAKAVARKSFMLRPNMPRFVRWGDKVVIASSIVNQSEEALKGTVRMRLLDPVTGDVVLKMEKPFSMEAGKTVGVDFAFDVKEEWNDLDCEIIAMSGNVSDGEKNPLPVLSTKKEVVEAVPYYIIGNADGQEVSKTMDLTKLFNENSNTATNRTLKVEYTDNPAWMCIEALRSVKNPTEDNAIDLATALYANTRLVELMQTFPVLEKHENLADLQGRVAKANEKLASLQLEDGGWSWFKGMQSSYYTTMAVCEQLAKLPKPTDRQKAMLKAGMEYMDKQELNSYNYAKQHKRKIWPSDSDMRYLYISAQMPERSVSKEVEAMREDYLSKVEKTPTDLTIYGVANAAYTLRAFGHVKAADHFVDFLKDYTVEKPGQGRFYATDAAYYSWTDYRIPTQVAAMKAIRQRDKKDPFLNDMQLWLISQKQVQKWDNPINTIDVADFLLQVSPMETFHETKKPVLIVDGTELKDMDYGTINTERDELEGREANLILQGNVLADVPEDVLKSGVQQLEVKKQTPGISWGAAYATFLEDVGNLKLYATDELKIQRKFYVKTVGSSEWTDFDTNLPLKIGDKLKIRHIITADRDMDFVRVSAQHPACLEPLRHLSGYQWMGGRGCYLSIHDARFDMFFDWFTRGTTTVDMEYVVVRDGTYQVGISTVECVYAKQFGGHTEGVRINAKTEK